VDEMQQDDIFDQFVMSAKSDLDGNCVDASTALLERTGFTKEELVNHEAILVPQEIKDKIKEIIDHDDVWMGEIKQNTKNGIEFWTHSVVVPTDDGVGHRTGSITIEYDITDKKKLEKLAITDGLTKVYNRGYFNNMYKKLIMSAQYQKSKIALCIVDIDNFKLYNDTYGHPAGDDVLIKIADLLECNVNHDTDFVFRLGGEEFGIIFQNKTGIEATELVENMRQQIENLGIEHKAVESKIITASFGFLCVDFAQENVDELEIYSMADKALYRAKESGRNRVITVHDEL
jgi:diguanylate cyclase (GGDEF)-like protein/PAS domain S-box-containing protein